MPLHHTALTAAVVVIGFSLFPARVEAGPAYLDVGGYVSGPQPGGFRSPVVGRSYGGPSWSGGADYTGSGSVTHTLPQDLNWDVAGYPGDYTASFAAEGDASRGLFGLETAGTPSPPGAASWIEPPSAYAYVMHHETYTFDFDYGAPPSIALTVGINGDVSHDSPGAARLRMTVAVGPRYEAPEIIVINWYSGSGAETGPLGSRPENRIVIPLHMRPYSRTFDVSLSMQSWSYGASSQFTADMRFDASVPDGVSLTTGSGIDADLIQFTQVPAPTFPFFLVGALALMFLPGRRRDQRQSV